MRINEKIALVGEKIILVPYREEHVATYHKWMSDPELLEATASEPLSLDEEKEMQKSWHVDENKLTFIILARPASETDGKVDPTNEEIAKLPMIGDVNLFLKGDPELKTDERDQENVEVECEVMIAEPEYRGKGLGHAALCTLLSYASEPLPRGLEYPREVFVARIGASNKRSISLFQKLGFGITKEANVFGEVELRYGQGEMAGDVKSEWNVQWERRDYE